MSGRPPVIECADHTLMCRLPDGDGPPPPLPDAVADAWDEYHVRLPCSPQSLYPLTTDDHTDGGAEEPGVKLVSRWAVIERALREPLDDCDCLERAIKRYNSRFRRRWELGALRQLVTHELSEAEARHLFDSTLPAMARLALRLPQLIRRPLPLLRRHRQHAVSLSQQQAACLLANAFFCTFPRRNSWNPASVPVAANGQRDCTCAGGRLLPAINMSRLFASAGCSAAVLQRRVEKLKCLLHYFRRVTSATPCGLLTFARRSPPSSHLPDWLTCERRMSPPAVSVDALIEQQHGLLHVDFANRLVGGGVLGSGCVQEEVRFCQQPELLVACLLTERLCTREAVLVCGAEWFSKTSGYSDSFTWTGRHNDDTSTDVYGRRMSQLALIDALDFSSSGGGVCSQYEQRNLVRELNKAYVGFSVSDSWRRSAECRDVDHSLPAVATGNWGCGAFCGDASLKSLLQAMAAAAAGRSLFYCTFGDRHLAERLMRLAALLSGDNHAVTVGRIMCLLLEETAATAGECGGRDLLQAIVDRLTLPPSQPRCHDNKQVTSQNSSATCVSTALARTAGSPDDTGRVEETESETDLDEAMITVLSQPDEQKPCTESSNSEHAEYAAGSKRARSDIRFYFKHTTRRSP